MFKKKNNQDKILRFLAFALLGVVFLNFLLHVFFWKDGWKEIIWFCNISAIVLSMSILFKKNYLTTIVLTTIIPAQFLWILDFIITFLGLGSLGRTLWLFQYPLFVVLPSIILHLFLIPISIYTSYILGFKKKNFFKGLFFFLILLLVSFYISPMEDNINCVFYPCDMSYEDMVYSQGLDFVPGSVDYLKKITLSWVGVYTLSYYFFLILFAKVFKNVRIE